MVQKFECVHDLRGFCIGLFLRAMVVQVRVVSQGPGERSFHAFYQLCNGATDTMRKMYGSLLSQACILLSHLSAACQHPTQPRCFAQPAPRTQTLSPSAHLKQATVGVVSIVW